MNSGQLCFTHTNAPQCMYHFLPPVVVTTLALHSFALCVCPKNLHRLDPEDAYLNGNSLCFMASLVCN